MTGAQTLDVVLFSIIIVASLIQIAYVIFKPTTRDTVDVVLAIILTIVIIVSIVFIYLTTSNNAYIEYMHGTK